MLKTAAITWAIIASVLMSFIYVQDTTTPGLTPKQIQENEQTQATLMFVLGAGSVALLAASIRDPY